jgi:large conductance mechanosensitive channel
VADMRERGTSFLTESSDFAVKAIASSLAIGVTTGAAIGAIVSSIVAAVFVPLFGGIIGEVDFSRLFVVSTPADMPAPSQAVA